VPLEVRPVDTAWSSDSLARGVRPRDSLPTVTGFARGQPPSVVRVDVTPIVRALARAAADAGIAVRATASSGSGVTLVTAAAGAPRLEVYLERTDLANRAW
jgi:hypothetical protein